MDSLEEAMVSNFKIPTVTIINSNTAEYFNIEEPEYYGWTILNSNYWKHNSSEPRNYFGNNLDLSGNFFYHTDSDKHYEIRSNTDLHTVTITDNTPTYSVDKLIEMHRSLRLGKPRTSNENDLRNKVMENIVNKINWETQSTL